MIRFVLLFLIRLYQLLISPLLGPSCRFVPSCSQYTYEAVQIYGPVKGLLLGAWRLLRCHPLHPGGYDPVVKPTQTTSCGSHMECS